MPPMNSTDPHLLDEGDPALDSRSFRRALGQFATGVTIMTAMVDDRALGVTANSFSSVSLDPPLVLWSLRKASQNLAGFRAVDHFAINVLAADQTELSNRFSRSSGDRFGQFEWRQGIGGVPLLSGVAAQFECRRVAEHDGGDHVIFIGHVMRFRCFDRATLVFSQGRYALPLDHPGSSVQASMDGAGHPRDDFFLPLLVRAYAYLSRRFDEHRDAEGLDVNQSRVLAFLATRSGSVDVVAKLTFLGTAAVEDAVAKLIAIGYAAPRPPGAVAVTQEGLDCLQRITRQAHAFEAEQFADLDPAKVAAARDVLLALAKRDGS
jgi:4-hydroxyphenylacetate 3-hydroxylase, reductase component